MIGIVNEPVQNADTVATMRSTYYPNAYAAIRSAESALSIASNNQLHVQFMNSLWGSGDPDQYLPNNYFASYDDHRYLKWDSKVAVSQSSYISTSCSDNRGVNWPTVVGEFSLSVPEMCSGLQVGIRVRSRHFTRSGLRHRLLLMKRIRWVGSFGLGRVSWGIIGGRIKVCSLCGNWREVWLMRMQMLLLRGLFLRIRRMYIRMGHADGHNVCKKM